MASYSSQPAFSYKPTLRADNVNPPIVDDNTDPSIFAQAMYRSADGPSIVTKITLSATGDLVYDTVLSKMVYIYIFDNSESTYALYYNAPLAAATLSTTTVNPVITFEPTGGILLDTDDQIFFAVSRNGEHTTPADQMSYVVEGSYF